MLFRCFAAITGGVLNKAANREKSRHQSVGENRLWVQ